jgi:WD40 repeat protein
MSPPNSRFYIAGGTLPAHAPSYIERDADHALLDALCTGEYCYVLDTRQVGKSSLMVRAASCLRERGVRVAIVDLTQVGQVASDESWYYGLLLIVAEQLRLLPEMEAFWKSRIGLPPLQRWMEALRSVALADPVQGPLVVFIDEIDYLVGLNLPADEFFAGIRSCYNRRIEYEPLRHLTFCLLGSSTPDRLIRDPRKTPFNIGRRIELCDFRIESREAVKLAQGMSSEGRDGVVLLQRVFWWTGGHPYLTQRLCQAVAGDPNADGPAAVDRICQAVFFARHERAADLHLPYVEKRLLEEAGDVSSLLSLYRRILRGRIRISHDPLNPLHTQMCLSGVVRVADGALQIRNRVYAHVFDTTWIHEHMPPAPWWPVVKVWLQAGSVMILLLALMGGLTWLVRSEHEKTRLFWEDKLKSEAIKKLGFQQQMAETKEYRADMQLAGVSWALKDYFRLPEELQKIPTQFRSSFEYRLLQHAGRQEAQVLPNQFLHGDASARFLAGGLRVVAASAEAQLPVFDAATGRRLPGYAAPTGDTPVSVAVSRDDRFVAAGCSNGAVLLWRASERRPLMADRSLKGKVRAIDLSADGQWLVAADLYGNVALYTTTGRRLNTTRLGSGVYGLSIHPVGSQIALGCAHRTVAVLSLPGLEPICIARAADEIAHDVAYAPDGMRIALADHSGKVVLLDAETLRADPSRFPIVEPGLKGEVRIPLSVAFSPDGRRLAIAYEYGVICVYDVDTWSRVAEFEGHELHVNTVRFSPDGLSLVSAAWDNTIRIWDLTRHPPIQVVKLPRYQLAVAFTDSGNTAITEMQQGGIFRIRLEALQPAVTPLANFEAAGRLSTESIGLRTVAMAPDGKSVVMSLSPRVSCLRDLRNGRVLREFPELRGGLTWAAWRRDGKQMATADLSGDVRIWNTLTGQCLQVLDGRRCSVMCVEWSPDGRLIATAGGTNPGIAKGDDTIRLWDSATFQPIATLTGHNGRVLQVAFSPDSKTLYSCGWDGMLRIWDVSSGKAQVPVRPLRSIQADNDVLKCLAVSPDGHRLATGTSDGTLKIWDISQRDLPEEVLILPRTEIGIGDSWSLRFSSDGTKLAAVTDMNSLVVLNAAP